MAQELQLSVSIGISSLVILLTTFILFLWIGSRQISPRRRLSLNKGSLPSPTRRKRLHERYIRSLSPDIEHTMTEFAQNESLSPSPSTLTPTQAFIQSILAQVHLFSYVNNQNVLQEIAQHATVLECKAQEQLFQQGDHDGALYIVGKGSVEFRADESFAITIHECMCVNSLLMLLCGLVDQQLGDERNVLQSLTANVSAVVLEPSRIIKVSPRAFSALFDQFPNDMIRIGRAILSKLDRVTIRSLLHHFGIAQMILNPTPLLELSTSEPTDDQELLRFYLQRIASAFDVQEDELGAELQLRRCPPNSVLQKFNVSRCDLYFVVDGRVRLETKVENEVLPVYDATKGHVIGMLAAYTGGVTLSRAVVAEEGTATVIQMPYTTFCRLFSIPTVFLRCSRHLITQFSDLVLQADSFFDWISLRSGERLFSVGDASNDMYLIMSGRVRFVHKETDENHSSPVVELSKGATLNAMHMVTSSPSTATAYAIRDTQLSRMPRVLFNYVVSKHPQVLLHFTKMVSEMMLAHESQRRDEDRQFREKKLRVNTISVISANPSIPIDEFAKELTDTLSTIATTSHLSSSDAREYIGLRWFSNSSLMEIDLSSWLGENEILNDIVVYEGDRTLTPWSKLCIRQADHILLLVMAHEEINLGKVQHILEEAWDRKNVRISLVRVCNEAWSGDGLVDTTDDDVDMFTFCEQQAWLDRMYNVRVPLNENSIDLLRLARRITGLSIGLVLGGGGARGLSHIGVIRALEECGVPVDIVGGTSIGAFIAALYARHPDNWCRILHAVINFSGSMSSILEKLLDLTLPIASFFNGSRFSAAIKKVFGDAKIENLALNYFCITTDIANSRMGVHRSGPIWKYVRASMSLQGYLPPVSDGKSLLLDGGYMNNLPSDVMRNENVHSVIAVDVGREPRADYYPYGHCVSGWWLLWNKINPFVETVVVPSMGDVSASLAYVSSVQHRNQVRRQCTDLYLKVPVEKYSVLQFDKLEELVEIGYTFAKPLIREWMHKNPDLFQRSVKSPQSINKRRPSWGF